MSSSLDLCDYLFVHAVGFPCWDAESLETKTKYMKDSVDYMSERLIYFAYATMVDHFVVHAIYMRIDYEEFNRLLIESDIGIVVSIPCFQTIQMDMGHATDGTDFTVHVDKRGTIPDTYKEPEGYGEFDSSDDGSTNDEDELEQPTEAEEGMGSI